MITFTRIYKPYLILHYILTLITLYLCSFIVHGIAIETDKLNQEQCLHEKKATLGQLNYKDISTITVNDMMVSYQSFIDIGCLDFLSYCEKVDNDDLFIVMNNTHKNNTDQIITDFIRKVPYFSLHKNTLQQRYHFISELITKNFSIYSENGCNEEDRSLSVRHILHFSFNYISIPLITIPQQHTKPFFLNVLNNATHILKSTTGKFCAFVISLSSCIGSATETSDAYSEEVNEKIELKEYLTKYNPGVNFICNSKYCAINPANCNPDINYICGIKYCKINPVTKVDRLPLAKLIKKIADYLLKPTSLLLHSARLENTMLPRHL